MAAIFIVPALLALLMLTEIWGVGERESERESGRESGRDAATKPHDHPIGQLSTDGQQA
jgi:hypothetical protein